MAQNRSQTEPRCFIGNTDRINQLDVACEHGNLLMRPYNWLRRVRVLLVTQQLLITTLHAVSNCNNAVSLYVLTTLDGYPFRRNHQCV